MNWYLEVWKKYAVFTGRARRSEYWYFVLFNGLAMLPLYLFGLLMEVEILLVLYFLYAIVALIPSLAVAVRRLHDTGRSGWNYFMALIPIVGPFILLFYLAEDGVPGENKYGPNPKEPHQDPILV